MNPTTRPFYDQEDSRPFTADDEVRASARWQTFDLTGDDDAEKIWPWLMNDTEAKAA